MKKILCFSISLMMLLGYAGASTATTYAGTSVPKAKAAYAAAEKSERAAQSRYNTAAGQFRTGSFGFYQWIASTSTGWKKADAQEALQVLTKSSFRKYTKKGNPKDATTLNNTKIKSIKKRTIKNGSRITIQDKDWNNRIEVKMYNKKTRLTETYFLLF